MKNNPIDLTYKKDFILEILEEKDVYSGRKILNLYVFLLQESIYELNVSICVIDKDSFKIKLISDKLEMEYHSDIKNKNDKKILKFLIRFKENDNLDYNIVITNLIDLSIAKNIDFAKLEMFRTKIEIKEEGCKYEF
jgi:site-specific recombinase